MSRTPGSVDDKVSGVVHSLRREAATLAHRAIDRYVDESGLYTPETMPDHLYRDSLHTQRTFIDTALRSVLEPDLDVRRLMRTVVERGNDRVVEGLPLRNYLQCWQLGLDTLLVALDARLPPDLVGPVTARVRAVYDTVIREAVGAYELTSREVAAAQDERSARLMAHLLDGAYYPYGNDPGALPERPVVVLLDIGATPAELTGPEQTRAIAAIRKARRISSALNRDVDGLWLADVRGTFARLITSRHPQGLESAVSRIQETYSVPVTAAMVPARDARDLRRAARVAADVLRIAQRTGRTGAVSSIEDVALEHHLAHESASLPVLIERCAPLRARADLVETLLAYLDNDVDRRRTADSLGVHPNTVDNRLSRIRELTDLDVRHFPDLLTLAIGTNPASGLAVADQDADVPT